MFTLLGALIVPENTSQYYCKTELAKNVLTVEEQRLLDVCVCVCECVHRVCMSINMYSCDFPNMFHLFDVYK